MVPEGVLRIGRGAFKNCYDLMSVTIPDSVESIGKDAFDECVKLRVFCSKDSYAYKYCQQNRLLIN